MSKIDTIVKEYNSCFDCRNCTGPIFIKGSWKRKCMMKDSVIPDIYNIIPEWCPLPDKEVSDEHRRL